MQTSNITSFYWMAPELIKAGLIRNEDWIEPVIVRADKLFRSDGALNIAASLLTVSDPSAIEYVEAAPVICLMATKGHDLYNKEERIKLFKKWKGVFKDQPKLREVMDSFDVSYPLRKLSHDEMQNEHYAVVRRLNDIEEVSIPNMIPTQYQMHWLQCLVQWMNHVKSRFPDQYQKKQDGFEWAALRFGQYFSAAAMFPLKQNMSNSAVDLCDYCLTPDSGFSDRQTYEQAVKGSAAWHEELARKGNAGRFELEHKMKWDAKISYGDLPTEKEFEVEQEDKDKKLQKLKFQVIALQSGKDLFEEGRIMHHCVGSYAGSVINGRSRIFSVRSEHSVDRPHATFELSGSGEGEKSTYRLNQQKALQNAAPDAVTQEIIKRFINYVNDPKNRQSGDTATGNTKRRKD